MWKAFKHLLVLTIVSLPGLILAQPKVPSLHELIDSALHKDYNFANRQLDIQSANIDQLKLKEAYLPRIDIIAKDAFLLSSFGVKSNELIIPDLNIDIKEHKNRYTTTSNLVAAVAEASMLLYSGGKIPQLKKALNEKIKAQTFILEKDRQEIISEVTKAYDQLALLKQIRRVLDESEKRLAENMKAADKAFGYGLITKYERQKIEVSQAQLSSKILEYEGKRGLVLQQLYLLTNVDKERLAIISNTLISFDNVSFEHGIENRAELKALDATIAANGFKIKAEKTWFIPKVQAAGSLGYFGLLAGHVSSSEPILPNGKKLSSDLPNLNVLPVFNVGIGFKWNFFDGKEGKHEVQKAEIEREKSINDKKEATDKLELNLANAQTNYTTAVAQVNVKNKQQQIAENALTQATKEYRIGLIKTAQLIDAEDDFQNAALDYVQAIFNQRRAAIDLLKATGNLTVQSIQ